MIKLNQFISRSIGITFAVLILLSFLLETSFGIYSLQNDRKAARQDIFRNIGNTIRDPINQGSYIEAYDRLSKLAGSNGIDCIGLKIDLQSFGKCEGSPNQEVVTVEKSSLLNTTNLEIIAAIDDRDIWRKHGFNSLGRLILYLGILGSLTFVLRKKISFIAFELNLVKENFHSDKSIASALSIEEIKELSITLQQLLLEQKQAQTNKIIYEVARQVAHDIRSPLSAINVISKKISDITPDYSQVLHSASLSLNEIATDLLDKTRKVSVESSNSSSLNVYTKKTLDNTAELNSDSLPKMIDDVIAQKKLSIPSETIRLKFYNSLRFEKRYRGSLSVLKRIFSNLLSNAIEAIVDSGFVSVEVLQQGDSLVVEIRDSGKGISEELLHKIGQQPISSGKDNGNGLGLFHAITEVESWGGKLEIQSKENSGTTIKIHLMEI